jgi:SHS2 domain-containing protein
MKGMKASQAGFREVEHTADWALEVWAPDMVGLLEQAARGMYALVKARLEHGPRVTHRLQLTAIDCESLLVAFLNELLYLGEVEGLGFDTYDLRVDGDALQARLEGAALAGQSKEIKAVTYNDLAVQETGRGLEVRIVFDV